MIKNSDLRNKDFLKLQNNNPKKHTHLKLSIIVVVFDMQREAPQTLYTLSSQYQTNVEEEDYQIIVVENGSNQKLDTEMVASFGNNFEYIYHNTTAVSPCQAMNIGIEKADSDYVMCIIDGARMLSPGIVSKTINCINAYPNPMVYALNLHLGTWHQNLAHLTGYNQQKETKLLNSVDWKSNGYELFDISNVRTSPFNFFSCLYESNCFTVRKSELLAIGGFDEQFTSVGGGVVNRHLFTSFAENENIQMVSLLGEATFHQAHGGVTNNRPNNAELGKVFEEEYQRLYQRKIETPKYQAHYYGTLSDNCRFLLPVPKVVEIIDKSVKLLKENNFEEVIKLLEDYQEYFLYNVRVMALLGQAYLQNNNLEKAAKQYQKITKFDRHYYFDLGKVRLAQGDRNAAFNAFKTAADFNKLNPIPRFFQAKLLLEDGKEKEAQPLFEQSISLLNIKDFNKNHCFAIVRQLIHLEKYNLAHQAILIGESRLKNDGELHFLKGLNYLKKGEEFLATQIEFEKALSCNENSPWRYYNTYLNFLMQHEKYDKVLVVCENASKQFADNEKLAYLKNQVHKLNNVNQTDQPFFLSETF